MKSKFLKYIFLLPLVFLAFTTSCKDDDDDVSTININITEVGTRNSGVVNAGGDFHLEAEITASAKIAGVNVEIKSKNNSSALVISKNYDDYNGQINAELHKHMDIPAVQPVGDYTVTVTVKDQTGKTHSESKDLKIEPNTDDLFEIEITEVGHNGHGHVGEDLALHAHIDTVNPIASIEVEIHHETNQSAPVITKEFTNYNGQTHIHFEELIPISASQPMGDYHLHLTVRDNKGNSSTEEYELELVKH